MRVNPVNQAFVRFMLVSAALVQAAIAFEPVPTITVLLYNYASLTPGTIDIIEHEVDSIFLSTGVGIDWIEVPALPLKANRNLAPAHSAGPSRIAIRLFSGFMTSRLKPRAQELGRALLAANDEFGVVADVFADLTKRFCVGRESSHGLVLGVVVAHELGHLLLGAGAHSPGGIMQAGWHPREIDKALQGHLLFTHSQCRQIREQVDARIVASQ